MTRAASGGSLGEWLEVEEIVPAGAGTIADVAHVRSLLIGAARAGRVLSYAGLLRDLGHRFTRPRMRALCRTLDAIDAAGAAMGEPALAVLVVRESDGLPGQGWWVGAAERGHAGPWTGPEAASHVAARQEDAFRHWGLAADRSRAYPTARAYEPSPAGRH